MRRTSSANVESKRVAAALSPVEHFAPSLRFLLRAAGSRPAAG
ncbi:MAG TPA: hypothetical protein VJT82_04590 [Pyrinomonadaceae bacterium]|nr:hypothetical protein [Pyrinomonadaceae bacterium]